jgi:hypothetical protein
MFERSPLLRQFRDVSSFVSRHSELFMDLCMCFIVLTVLHKWLHSVFFFFVNINKGWVLRPVPLKIKMFLKSTVLYNEKGMSGNYAELPSFAVCYCSFLSFPFLSFPFLSSPLLSSPLLSSPVDYRLRSLFRGASTDPTGLCNY